MVKPIGTLTKRAHFLNEIKDNFPFTFVRHVLENNDLRDIGWM